MREDGVFADIQREIPKPKSQKARKNACILADTWRLVDTRISARRYPTHDQAPIRRLRCAINETLKADQRRSTVDSGGKIEALLASDPFTTRKHVTI